MGSAGEASTCQVPRVSSCTLCLILLVWLQKQQLSAGSYGECCFTSGSANSPLKAPAKSLMSLVLRCDIRFRLYKSGTGSPTSPGRLCNQQVTKGTESYSQGPALLSSCRATLTFLWGCGNSPTITTESVTRLFTGLPFLPLLPLVVCLNPSDL